MSDTHYPRKWGIRRIESLKRLNNSVNGNPRYLVTFTDGSSAKTVSDAACCYGITNPELLRGLVVVEFTREGNISHIGPYRPGQAYIGPTQ